METIKVAKLNFYFGLLSLLLAVAFTAPVVIKSVIAQGVSPLVATQLGLWTVYPIGGFIGFALLGMLLGIVNIGLTLRVKTQ